MGDNSLSAGAYNLQFMDKHLPALEDGDYKIIINHNLESTDNTKPISAPGYSAEATFAVYGPRFSLSPDDVYEVFPPNNSTGEHSNVMAHIMLNRSTLPWERRTNEEDEDTSWLALLIFYEEEKPETSTITVSDLVGQLKYITKESFQKDDDKVTVIDVDQELLSKILPSKDELRYLAHVRSVQRAEQAPDIEYSAIVANRLPKKKGMSIAHLVSLENCFSANGFDYEQTKVGDKIRLVSLMSFQFSCLTKDQSFKGLLENLNTDIEAREKSSICTLRLPDSPDAKVNKYLAMGYVPLYQYLRSGKKTAAWYHSPFAVNDIDYISNMTLPAKSSDDLLIYDKDNGMFDISYSAAWEIGRLMGLSNKRFSTGMYCWKRAQEQQVKIKEQDGACSIKKAFYLAKDHDASINIPEVIKTWVIDTQLLKGIPFKYLVPDESMFPQESIRFFKLDKFWVSALLDGAFSIGRISTKEYDAEKNLRGNIFPDEEITGILLRSEVVSGWPGLLADALDDEGNKLNRLRMSRLSSDILLCLFKGTLAEVDIFKKAESLNFGVDDDDNSIKELRNPVTNSNENCPNITVPLNDDRVIDICALVQNIISGAADAGRSIDQIASAGFAYEMIEGAERVLFKPEKDVR